VREAVLYQFALCPFCSKVRAGLELKGIPFRTVEVNPRTKVELPPLPDGAPRKVPVLTLDDTIVYDSTTILRFLDQAYPETVRFRPEDAAQAKQADEIEEWVDAELIRALPTVLYGTWREAAQAAGVVAKSGNFSGMQNLGVKLGGSVIMHMVAKRLLKKSGRSDGHAWVHENLDRIDGFLATQPFVCGSTLTVADVAIFGALSCVEAFPIFESIAARPRIARWLARMAEHKHAAQRERASARRDMRPHVEA
jgi:glutathione S-transferase